MTCQLYRHFDKEGSLLYVGISLSAVSRLSGHQASGWVTEINRVEIESFPDRASAAIAEWEAIREEKPRYNITGAIYPGGRESRGAFDRVAYQREYMRKRRAARSARITHRKLNG